MAAARFSTFLRGAFGVARPADTAAAARVKSWARDALDGAPDTVFAVNEIACTDPSCPGLETVVLVMRAGHKTRAVKVSKALEDVTEQDIRAALLP